MRLKPFFFANLLCLLSLVAGAQPPAYVLDGEVSIKDGPVCSYHVTVYISDNKVSGNSVTMQPGGGELKALITGFIDPSKHLLVFAESKEPISFPFGDCMFDVKLNYKKVKGKYVFTGRFIGKNANGNRCDEGIVQLETPVKADMPFEIAKPKKHTAAIPSADTIAESPPELTKITAVSRQEYSWHADSCVLEIWDGEVVDGDIVTVRLNDRNMLTGYSLVAAKKRLALPLKRGTNTISIIAENEGKAPPNTAMIHLTDGVHEHELLSCLKKGEAATIVIHKK